VLGRPVPALDGFVRIDPDGGVGTLGRGVQAFSLIEVYWAHTMARLGWLVRKEVAEPDKVVDLEDFLRSAMEIDDEVRQPAERLEDKDLTVELDDDIDGALDALDGDAPPEPRLLNLDERLSEAARQIPSPEPSPKELDELLDEALSETFPASDPIAVSPAP
jgi:hypothetical protein